jgi:hypothetical protein
MNIARSRIDVAFDMTTLPGMTDKEIAHQVLNAASGADFIVGLAELQARHNDGLTSEYEFLMQVYTLIGEVIGKWGPKV